ncbi:MAG: TonB-dependent receptor, partial [Chitinophagaceae bacterium]
MKPTNRTGSTQRTSIYQQLFAFFLSLVIPLFLSFAPSSGHAQASSQTLRGTITDQVLQTPVGGATVCLPALNRCTVTDSLGNFRFGAVPLGKQRLQVTTSGYREVVLEQVVLDAGKETVLTIPLENDYRITTAIIVKSQSRRNKPLNEMSAVSARAFTVEETQRYAAALNDPSRMATAFPGVFATDDGNNNIAIRGNSPTGLLWRMEGVDIPNPNHFASTGGSGGGISILSAQLLANSDFVTGAFAPEYGNALGGVFDLRLRKGNNERREYTLQAGLLGLNASMEGPFRKGYGGSFLINYRYSTLQLLNKLGVEIAGGSINFQDLSYNFHLPTRRAGTFTLFGFHGRSDQHTEPDLDSLKWETRSDRITGNFLSNTDVSGATHTISLGGRTSLRTVAAYSSSRIRDDWSFIQDDFSRRLEYADNFRTRKGTLSSTLRYKLNAKGSIRAGVIGNLLSFRFFEEARAHEQAPLLKVIDVSGNTLLLQAFAQAQYKVLSRVSIQGGLHYLDLTYNHSRALEPRASVKWQLSDRNSIAFGFGQHSQVQPLGVYFATSTQPDGKTNRDLGLSKARHYVLSYQRALNRFLALKAEAYYQQLYNIPVSAYDSSTLSLLNVQSEYVTDPLVNVGTGRNYGLELSLEKYLDKAFYYTVSTSLFESKYKAMDGV